MGDKNRKLYVKRMVKHPEYTSHGRSEYDFALLELQRILVWTDKINKIELAPFDAVTPDDLCIVTQFGKTCQ